MNTLLNLNSSLNTTEKADLWSRRLSNCQVIDFPNSNKKTPKKTNPSVHRATDPIKDKNDIERAKSYFHDTPSRYKGLNLRNYCMFILGINIARRIGDLVNLKIKDIAYLNDNNIIFKEWIEIKEQKTDKWASFQIHPYVQEGLKEYFNTLPSLNSDMYIFKSREGENKPITTKRALQVIKDMASACDIKGNIGTHSMRKTKAYHLIKDNPNDPYIVAALSHELNHDSIKTTYEYCGFDKESRSPLYMSNVL